MQSNLTTNTLSHNSAIQPIATPFFTSTLKRVVLAFLVVFGMAGYSRAGYNPVPLTTSSFTYDIVVESNYPALPYQNAETVTMDAGPVTGGTPNTWFELGLDLPQFNHSISLFWFAPRRLLGYQPFQDRPRL